MMQNLTRKLRRNDDAISPVIGTILMVAATVIIAGAVYAAVNAYNGKSAKPAPDAAFKSQAIDSDGDGLEDMIKITYLSGPGGVANAAVTVASSGTNKLSPASTVTGTWDAGDFATWFACSATEYAQDEDATDGETVADDNICDATENGGAGSYFVTVTLGETTVLEQTLTLKE